MSVLRTQMGGRRVTIQGGGVGDTTTGFPVAVLDSSTAVIEAGTPADFVGVPRSRGGVEIGGGWDRRGHRAGWARSACGWWGQVSSSWQEQQLL